MLRIKSNPKKSPAQDVTFESPAILKQNGVEMLIALNMTPKMVLTGPEVNIDSKILVTKIRPHFFFNPVISEPKCLQSEPESSTICISYTNYQGEENQVSLADEDGSIRKAINHLNNGIERANKKRV